MMKKTFSIYSHIRPKPRGGPSQAPDSDDDETPSPPPSQRVSHVQVLPVKPSRVRTPQILPSPSKPSSVTSHPRPRRKSSPLFVQPSAYSSDGPQQHQSTPSSRIAVEPLHSIGSSPSEADEAVEAPIAEELQFGQPRPRPGAWVMDALVKQPSRAKTDSSPRRTEFSPRRTERAARKQQLLLNNKPYCLKLRRSLRGRLLAKSPATPVFKRNSTRYISPLTFDELETKSGEAASRAESPLDPASVANSQSSASPAAPRQLEMVQEPKTPEPKKRRRRPSTPESTPEERVRSGRQTRGQTTRSGEAKKRNQRSSNGWCSPDPFT
jgi:hypothetical protein